MNWRILTIAILVLLAGCSKVSKENYDKLKTGQDYDEVVNLLGKPDKCSDMLGATSCTWGSEERNIQVSFINKKLLLHTAKNIQ